VINKLLHYSRTNDNYSAALLEILKLLYAS